jgi:hypothetical protein
MPGRYGHLTRKERISSHLFHLSSLDIDDSGPLSLPVKRTIKLCLNSGAKMEDIAELIGRSSADIESELEKES